MQLSSRKRHADMDVGCVRAVLRGEDVLESWRGTVAEAPQHSRPVEEIYLSACVLQERNDSVRWEEAGGDAFVDAGRRADADSQHPDSNSEGESSDTAGPPACLQDAPSSTSSSSSSSSSSDSSSSSSSSTGPQSVKEPSSSSSSSSSTPSAKARSRPPSSVGAAQEQREQRDFLVVHAGSDATLSRVRFKPQSNDMYVNCIYHGSGCSRTRTCNASQKRQRQGRPLGELSAWALLGASCATAQEHKSAQPSLEQKQQARLDLHHDDAYASFTARERPRRDDEESEPE